MNHARLFPVMLALLALSCSGADDGTGTETCQISALPGDLVLTEVMADPLGADDGQEWIEIYNASTGPQCLNGLRVTVAGKTTSKDYFVVSTDRLEVPAGATYVLGTSAAPFVDFVFPESAAFTMANTTVLLTLQAAATVLDQLAWGEAEGSVGETDEGNSFALCGECRAPTCNDDATLWKVSRDPAYDATGNQGTPGEPNPDCACGSPDDAAPPEPGDLRITEVHANPAGTDGNFEWFEVRVEADHPILLAGLGLVKELGAEPVTAISEDSCLFGESGAYLLFAKGSEAADYNNFAPDFVFGSKLSLANTDGYLGLTVNGVLLADVSYEETTDGASLQWDDADETWCNGRTLYDDAGNLGTPGEANPGCSAPTGCLLDGTPVDLVAPQAGDLEITEFLPNTPGTELVGREWIEIRNKSEHAVDLNGLELWKEIDAEAPASILSSGDGSCLRLPPGLALLARSDDPAVSGLPQGSVFHVYAGLTLNNSGYLGLVLNGTTLDSVTYESSTDGAALQKAPDSGEWCDASQLYWTTPEGGGAFGTPGQANTACGLTFCISNGQQIPVVHPVPGSLVITEVFANPAGTDSNAREWFELLVTAQAQGTHLNGVRILMNNEEEGVFEGADGACIILQPGLLLVAGSADPETNGGIEDVDVVVSGVTLRNSDATFALSGESGVIDVMTYAEADSGKSMQLSPAHLNASDNDLPANWCASPMPYNTTPEYGTPGSENPACDAVFCTDAVTSSPVPLVPATTGGLVVTEVYANTPGADDLNREWLEVLVTGSQPFHLNGVGIADDSGEAPATVFNTAQCIVLNPGELVVLCRNADPTANGGLPSCIGYSSLTLKNSSATLGVTYDGVPLDELASYGTSTDGVTRSLDPQFATVSGNDDGAHWCDCPAGHTYGDGSVRGTPGTTNPSCL